MCVILWKRTPKYDAVKFGVFMLCPKNSQILILFSVYLCPCILKSLKSLIQYSIGNTTKSSKYCMI